MTISWLDGLLTVAVNAGGFVCLGFLPTSMEVFSFSFGRSVLVPTNLSYATIVHCIGSCL